MPQQTVYGLDIETATPDCDGPLDPRDAPIVKVAVSSAGDEFLFEDDERSLLGALDDFLDELEPGVIATWNGSSFDLPYLADRARICNIEIGLRLVEEARARRRSEHLVGHAGSYRAAWYEHRHLDAARLFGAGRRPLMDVDELLRALGLHGWRNRVEGPANAPGEELTHEAAHAFATNDARLVRTMVEGRLPSAMRQIDRLPDDVPVTAPEVAVYNRGRRVPLSPAHPAVRAMLAHQA